VIFDICLDIYNVHGKYAYPFGTIFDFDSPDNLTYKFSWILSSKHLYFIITPSEFDNIPLLAWEATVTDKIPAPPGFKGNSLLKAPPPQTYKSVQFMKDFYGFPVNFCFVLVEYRSPSLFFTQDGRLFLAFEFSGYIKLFWSDDLGERWRGPDEIGTGYNPVFSSGTEPAIVWTSGSSQPYEILTEIVNVSKEDTTSDSILTVRRGGKY